jgi:hypothetical protein
MKLFLYCLLNIEAGVKESLTCRLRTEIALMCVCVCVCVFENASEVQPEVNYYTLSHTSTEIALVDQHYFGK